MGPTCCTASPGKVVCLSERYAASASLSYENVTIFPYRSSGTVSLVVHNYADSVRAGAQAAG